MQSIYLKPKDQFCYNGIQTWSDYYLLSDGTVIQDGGNSQGIDWCRRYSSLSGCLSLAEIESYGEIIPDDPNYLERKVI